MSDAPPRGSLAALLAVTAALFAGLAAPVQAAALPTVATPSPPVDLTVASFDPVTVTPNRPLRISGQVRDMGGPVLRDVAVEVAVATTPVTARSAIDDSLADPGYLAPLPDATQSLGAVRAGQAATYRLRVDTTTLPVSVTGVYPLRLSVVATVRGARTTVAQVTTALPWYPDPSQVARTRMLFVWPLMAAPQRDRSGVFPDESLAQQLRPGGRLDTLVTAAADRPVAWFVDPALLADTSAMSAGYQVRGTPAAPGPAGSTAATPDASSPDTGSATGSATPTTPTDGPSAAEPPAIKGTGADDARRWLEQLNVASSRQTLAVVPYGDLDVASVVDARRAGLARSASRWGAAQAQTLLGRPVVRDVAWPVDGMASATTVDRLPRAGDRAVLLSGDQAPPTVVPAYTPSGRALVGADDFPALLTDPALDALVADPGNVDPVLARQRFLAETLLITAELPTASRLVAVAPPRRWNPTPAYADALMAAFTEARWLRPVSLDRALRWPVPTLAREDLPESAPDGQLPTSYVDAAAASFARLVTFAGILTEPNPTVPRFRSALYSSLSTYWRDDVEGGLRSLSATSTALDTDRDKVRIVSRGGTLTSNSGPFPITVVNDLDQDVQLGLDVESTDPLRLQITAPDTVKVPSGGRVSVDAEIDATTSGDLSATAQIVTPTVRAPYSEPVVLEVRVRAYGQVALLVFGGAAALLIMAAGIRVFRRVRRSRQTAAPEADDAALQAEADGAPGSTDDADADR